MKLHLITIGKPKLPYAKLGWDEYTGRLSKLHDVRMTHLADKFANNASKILAAIGSAYAVGLVIGADEFSSETLANFLQQRALEGRELAFVVGGPDGLPTEVIGRLDRLWGFSQLTFPHDLAMVVMAEALYRASTINLGTPYHH